MYKRDYAYKTLQQPKALLRRLKGKNLVSMTISQFQAPDKIIHDHLPTYLTTRATYDKDDFKTLGFDLFSNQNLLLSYLRDNASGLYKENAPMSFIVQRGQPQYYYNSWKLGKTNYILLHSLDCGLCYHILMGDNGFMMPVGLKKESFVNESDIYHIFQLINYGLLGRNTGIELHSVVSFKYVYDLSQTLITYSNIPGNDLPMKQFCFRLFNQSGSLSFNNKKRLVIKIIPNYQSQHEFANGKGLPKFQLQIMELNSQGRKPTTILTLNYSWLA